MLSSDLTFERLTIPAINSSSEIEQWLLQFPEEKRVLAAVMLLQLKFVSRDKYSLWLDKAINSLPYRKKYAVYAVRKLDNIHCLWDNNGKVVERSGGSLGSEDLVHSLIANITRKDNKTYFDHPSIDELRQKKIQDIVLIDDSINSGTRVSEFIAKILKHPSALSWWSLGILRLHVVSFARSREAEAKILHDLAGSDHWKRKYRKSAKIQFYSKIVYSCSEIESRWGRQAKDIIKLCQDTTSIKTKWRLGYRNVMSNIAFHHSVPNNLPGVIWCETDKWQPLFKGRSLPPWMTSLLSSSNSDNSSRQKVIHYDRNIIHLLTLIKGGHRVPTTIALKLDCEVEYVKKLLSLVQDLSLVSHGIRLTPMGLDAIKNTNPPRALPNYDRSLYIPSSWCASQVTTQPQSEDKLAYCRNADFVGSKFLANGDVGETSLE